jgi:hypothetical protein
MLDIYQKLTSIADDFGLHQAVDDIDKRMIRMSQAAPTGMTTGQYIQDIYRRLTALATEIQQMQQNQQVAPAQNKSQAPSLMQQTGIGNSGTMNQQTTNTIQQPVNLEIN